LKNAIYDIVGTMHMSTRLVLSALAISIGSLAPILPMEASSPVQKKAHCCADMNMNSSRSCPINNGAGSSTSGSACCTSPANCLPLYFGNPNAFVADSKMIGTVSVGNENAMTRSQRPLVPPPRIAFS
jgi:hypothetical protein